MTITISSTGDWSVPKIPEKHFILKHNIGLHYTKLLKMFTDIFYQILKIDDGPSIPMALLIC
jgi:hypothetical protein